jgi:hypothetical protein
VGTPQYPKDFGTWAQNVDRRIRSATTQAQSRLPFKTIKTAILTLIGSLVIKGGGSIKVINDAGVPLVTVGQIGFSPTGAPVTGVQVVRPNNSVAFTSYSTSDGSLDFNGFWDRSGTTVVSDDGVSGHGMATPWLPMPLPVPPDFNLSPNTQSSTLENVATSVAFATHPRIRLDIIGRSDSGTTGEFVVRVNGTQVGPTQSIPSAGNVRLEATADIPGWGTSVGYLGRIDIAIAARRISGSGTVYVSPQAVYAVQS